MNFRAQRRSSLVLLPILVACSSSGGGVSSASAAATATSKPTQTASAASKPLPNSGPGPSAAARTDTPPASTEKPVGDHANDPSLSDAKNWLGAISRAAVESYSRETIPSDISPDDSAGQQLSHALCASAKPVPADLPSGGERKPVKSEDFDGDAKAGWKCLRFAIAQPVSFRYTYNAGSNYLGPKRGGPDPGPDGYEACAEADLTPGGLTTLICIHGTVDKGNQTIKSATELFQADE